TNWLGGRGSIAFVSQRDGNPEIYLMDIDRGRVRRLTDDPAVDRHPAWSPDGRTLAFYSNRNGNWDIFVTDAAGRQTYPLVISAARDGNLVWSPDGEHLAFDSTRSGNLEIYVMDSACVEQRTACFYRQTTHHAAADQYPTWSPDGKHLVFESVRYEQYDLLMMDEDGENVRRLTDNAYPDWGANWSPDGTQIVYASGKGAADWDLYVIDADCYQQIGGCDENARLLVEHPFDDVTPVWSPDGRYVIFASWIDDDYELFIVNADGTDLEQLTSNVVDDEQAVWWPR
ncbi:MAG: hypothetical protein K8L99_22020, partial [Anaerolineae bacterium]|nr:hypothetical protein [Anaerolineae bacterium]